MKAKPEICAERAFIITEAYEEYKDELPTMLRAKAFAKILKEMTIYIEDGELIVGNHAKKPKAIPIFPEFSTDWILSELDTMEHRSVGKCFVSDETKSILREILPKWQGRTTKDRSLALLSDDVKVHMKNFLYLLSPLTCGIGHIAVNNDKIVNGGLQSVIDDLLLRIGACDGRDCSNVPRVIFYRSCIIVLQAVIDFAERFATLATEQAAQKTGQRKEELLEIARICSKVPRQPADTFHEALQSFWFLQLCMQIESNGHAITPGRFDQYMYRAFRKDLDRGVSKEQLAELMGLMFVKFNEPGKLRNEVGSKAFAGNGQFQNLIVGGVDENGNDVTNELSFLCLETSRDIMLPQPTLSLRWHRNMNKELLLEAASLTRTGIGMPAYFNDEIIIPILQKMGFTLEEARTYCEVGCVEPHVPGKTEGMYATGFVSLGKILELALFNGVNPITNEKIGAETGLQFEDFEAFYQACVEQLRHMIKIHTRAVSIVDYVNSQMCPTPLVSCFVEDCFDKGIDVRAGGAHVNCYAPNAVGLANMADSLQVIKQKVFEEKKYTFDQIREILLKDYVGYETVRQEFINDVPKYGNDIEDVDKLARRFGETFCSEYMQYKGFRDGYFSPGLQTISTHVLFADSVGATPDGRTNNMLMADGGVSPAQGRDTNGPTADLISVSRLNHLAVTNGSLLNVKFHPSSLKGTHGLEKLCALINAFFKMGGQHVQFNIVDSNVLRDAQKHPEDYEDLVVRVAGFSVLFTTVDSVLQNDIIARTEHSLV